MRNLNYKHKKLLEFIKKIYGDTLADKRLLDIGGNDGLILSNLPQCLAKVAFDIYIDALRVAEHDKILGDVHYLPLKDRSFDVCIFSEVPDHVHSPEMVIAEITRISDEVILTTPNNSLIRKMMLLPGLVVRWGLSFVFQRFNQYRKVSISSRLRGHYLFNGGFTTHVREYSWKEVKDFFKNEGFELKRFEAIENFIGRSDSMRRVERFPRLAGKMLMHFQRVDKTCKKR